MIIRTSIIFLVSLLVGVIVGDRLWAPAHGDAASPGQGGPAMAGETCDIYAEHCEVLGQRTAVQAEKPPAKAKAEAQAEKLLDRVEAAERKVAAYETTFSNLEAMRFQVRQLECKAALEPDGQIGRWAATVDVVPDEGTLFRMAQLMHDYPVELQPEDGLWLVDRIRFDDWFTFAPTVDEAIVAYFGDRISQP